MLVKSGGVARGCSVREKDALRVPIVCNKKHRFKHSHGASPFSPFLLTLVAYLAAPYSSTTPFP